MAVNGSYDEIYKDTGVVSRGGCRSNMLCNAQGGKKAMVDCYTSKDALKSIVLKSVKDGKTWRLAEGMCLNDDYFGFGCVPTYSGIYVVGDGKFMEALALSGSRYGLSNREKVFPGE